MSKHAFDGKRLSGWWMPPAFLLYRCYEMATGVVSGAAASVVFPYLDERARGEIFADEGLSPHERTYAKAFKRATAEGERSRGAHVRALSAVFEDGGRVRAQHPVRSRLSDLFEWLSGSVSPNRGAS